jgi:hypothetical protein
MREQTCSQPLQMQIHWVRARPSCQMKLSIDRWIIQLHIDARFDGTCGRLRALDVMSHHGVSRPKPFLRAGYAFYGLGNWISSFVQVELHLALIAAQQQSSCQPPR